MSADSWSGAVSLYLVLAALVVVPGLGSTSLIMMEGMVDDTAQTMLATGDYLVPRLYGEIYTYKPPLVYWLTALSTTAGGRTEWALRLPSAVSMALLGVTLLALVGRLTRPRTGLYAAAAATTGALAVQKLTVAEFDAILAGAVGIAVAAACHNLARGRSKASSGLWVTCYLALAAAFLAKGTPALMAFGPGLLAGAVVTGEWRQLLSRSHLVAMTLFAVLIGGYLWLVWDVAGAAAFVQPLQEARARGLEWTPGTLGRTLLKPLIICGVFLPWSMVWPWSLSLVRGRIHVPAQPGTSRRLILAAWAFLAAGVLCFVAVPTHEVRYYLPLAAPGAILSAMALERLVDRPSRLAWKSCAGLGLLLGALSVGGSLLPTVPAVARGVMAAAGSALLAAVWLLSRSRSRHRVAYALLGIALAVWALETSTLRPRRAATRDLSSVARAFAADLPRRATVWVPGRADYIGKDASLYYYLGRPVRAFLPSDGLPPAGSYLILSAAKLIWLGEVTPGALERLRLVAEVDHPRRLFFLCRVTGAAAAGEELETALARGGRLSRGSSAGGVP